MGKCRYCGRPAGFLREKHRECEELRSNALAAVASATTRAGAGKADVELVRTVWQDATSKYASQADIRAAAVRGWEGAVEEALEDGLLEEAEEQRLVKLGRELDLTQDELDVRGGYSRLLRAAALRQIMNGEIPKATELQRDLPFNFQKSEQLIWLFQAVEYLEDKTRREYVGGYQGVSIRVAKGLYYRTGGFRGHPVERTERVSVDRGLLGVTNKHLYFGGRAKSFRIRHDKIVSYTPYSDGVGVMRDAATAKPQIFITGDGWFTYNLFMNVARL